MEIVGEFVENDAFCRKQGSALKFYFQKQSKMINLVKKIKITN
jgi:hypothetical protein